MCGCEHTEYKVHVELTSGHPKAQQSERPCMQVTRMDAGIADGYQVETAAAALLQQGNTPL